MFKLVQKAKKNQKGFTLVELMVVVVIIGILVAIAIPIYGSVTRNAANGAHEANVRTLVGAANMWIADNDLPETGTVTVALDEYVAEWPLTVPEASDATDGEYAVTVSHVGIILVTPGSLLP